MGAFKTAVVSASLASLALAHGHHEKRGTVPIDGKIWTTCVDPKAVALTFDDGPFQYTQSIVDKLTAAGHKATFFQNGLNYDSIYNYNDTLKSMIAGGHQIGSHTWAHADLGLLDAAGVTDQMGQLEAAHLAIIGKAPTYMRPPYLSLGDVATTTLKSLGYKIINVDIDTQDWAEAPIGEIAQSIEWYKGNQTNGGTMSLNHDVYEPTADTFIPAIIEYLASKGLKSVPAGECIGDDEVNWYRGSPAVSSSSSASIVSSTLSQSSTAAPSATPSGNGTIPSGPSASSSYGSGGPGASGSATGGHGSPTGGSGKPTSSAYPPHGGSGGYGSGGYGSGGSGSSSNPDCWGEGGWGTGSKPWSPRPVTGGDTETGHGPNAGRGSIPGHSGEGGGYTFSYGAASNGSSASAGSKPSNGTAGLAPQPSYYTNGASGLTASAVVIGVAALAFFL